MRPPPDPLFHTDYSSVLTSREGQLLSARIASDEQWRFPALDSIPQKYEQALLLFEDRYFYQHPGINPFSLVRAAYQNWKAGEIRSGGSTLTMQLARISQGNKPRTLINKIREIFLSFRIELYMEKKDILQQYTAHAPFGGNVVGLEAASWRYFGRSPYQLSWAESVCLAVLPNAPGLIYPGTRESQFIRKRNRLLKLIYQEGLIGELDYQLACEEGLPDRPKNLPDLAPHLMERAILENGSGKNFTSTLDYRLQAEINQVVEKYHRIFRKREVHNLAVLVTRISTNETMAYVGNTRRSGTVDHGQDVDLITSRRSPGSLLKPILYALALDEGLISPDQLLPDIPLYYQGFVPQNFDKKFKGAVPATNALQSSLNIPFVNLLKEYGYEKMHSRLRSLGLESIDQEPGHYGLTLILGGGEVTLWEISNLYGGMARSLKGFNSSKGNIE
jgi:penicillin-binding protein 1C